MVQVVGGLAESMLRRLTRVEPPKGETCGIKSNGGITHSIRPLRRDIERAVSCSEVEIEGTMFPGRQRRSGFHVVERAEVDRSRMAFAWPSHRHGVPRVLLAWAMALYGQTYGGGLQEI